jgi:hypothetical protein
MCGREKLVHNKLGQGKGGWTAFFFFRPATTDDATTAKQRKDEMEWHVAAPSPRFFSVSAEVLFNLLPQKRTNTKRPQLKYACLPPNPHPLVTTSPFATSQPTRCSFFFCRPAPIFSLCGYALVLPLYILRSTSMFMYLNVHVNSLFFCRPRQLSALSKPPRPSSNKILPLHTLLL